MVKMMANDNVELGKDEKIQIYFQVSPNIVEINGDGEIFLFHQVNTDERKKGKYKLVPE